MARKKKTGVENPMAAIAADVKGLRKIDWNYGHAVAPAVHTIEFYHRDCPQPLGIVWFWFSGADRLEILNSFVFELVRHCGIRTFLHDRLREHYPERDIISQRGTESGEAWMTAAGYKRGRPGWIFPAAKPSVGGLSGECRGTVRGSKRSRVRKLSRRQRDKGSAT
jgi:hypothetical protein